MSGSPQTPESTTSLLSISEAGHSLLGALAARRCPIPSAEVQGVLVTLAAAGFEIVSRADIEAKNRALGDMADNVRRWKNRHQSQSAKTKRARAKLAEQQKVIDQAAKCMKALGDQLFEDRYTSKGLAPCCYDVSYELAALAGLNDD